MKKRVLKEKTQLFIYIIEFILLILSIGFIEEKLIISAILLIPQIILLYILLKYGRED